MLRSGGAGLAGDRTCRRVGSRRVAIGAWRIFYITAHFSLSLIALLLCTGCNETERFFSRVSRSRNRASTLWFVLAEVSRKPQPQLAASAAPSLIDTSRTDGLSSLLFPTWTMNQAMGPLSRATNGKETRNEERLHAGIPLFCAKTNLNREPISERVKFREGRNRTRRFSVKFPQIPFRLIWRLYEEMATKITTFILSSKRRKDMSTDDFFFFLIC